MNKSHLKIHFFIYFVDISNFYFIIILNFYLHFLNIP